MVTQSEKNHYQGFFNFQSAKPLIKLTPGQPPTSNYIENTITVYTCIGFLQIHPVT